MPTFILEDGTGLATATSYVNDAFVNDFVPGWAAGKSTADKESAMMRATAFLDARWGVKLKGWPLVITQALEFPRNGAYDRYGRPLAEIPQDLARACALYAKEALAGNLYVTDTANSSTEIKKKKTVVGPITTEVEYRDDADLYDSKQFQQADDLMRKFIQASSGAVRS